MDENNFTEIIVSTTSEECEDSPPAYSEKPAANNQLITETLSHDFEGTLKCIIIYVVSYIVHMDVL